MNIFVEFVEELFLLQKFYIFKKKIFSKIPHRSETNIVMCSWWPFVYTHKNIDMLLIFYYL